MIPRVGSIAMASTWPAWEHQGLPLPHPIIVLAKWKNGNVAVAPITTKMELCIRHVELTRSTLPSGYPPLFRDPCWICVRDKDGDCIAVAEPIENCLKIGNQVLPLIDHRVLTGTDLSRVISDVQLARSQS